MDDTTLVADDTTRINNNIGGLGVSLLQNSTIFSTPTQQQNGHHNLTAANSQTVTKKRFRQQTVTVDNSQICKEIEDIFNRVKEMPGLENHTQELQRQMQKFFIEKTREWEYKHTEFKNSASEELALGKIKLKAAQSLLARMDEFTKQLNTKAQSLTRNNSSNGFLAQNGGEAQNGVSTPQSARTFSPDLTEIIKERDSLREELGQLENSYSDLFKRYEKMRENCVLLKNSEEELKNLLEEEQVKFQNLLARFQELRATASEQLDQANTEINRIMKQHEENTLGLRCRLKMNETQIQTLNLTIQGKDSQIEELNKMVEDLMQKNGLMDDIVDDSDEGSYN